MANTALVPKFSLRKSLPSLPAIITGIILIFLAWAFLSKTTMQLYASFLFLFYNFTHSMWVSVVMLGIFQTLLMIPFRIINLTKSKNIKDFEKKINEYESENEQSFLIKKTAKSGGKVILYYIVDFFVQLTSYLSIGRLFLTDFYKRPLDPNLLYSFVPYPDYPLLDVWFKIPYLKVIDTKDLGFQATLIVFLIIIVLSLLFSWLKSRISAATKDGDSTTNNSINNIIALFTGSAVLLMIVAYFLMRHFPTAVQLAIFTGDISKPNPRFNTITAIATAMTIFWLDVPVILKKVQLAKESGIDSKIIRRTQTALFAETLRSALLVGMGAYFITNRIPCAFELSIFTLEIISWLSPLTLDRFILKTKPILPAVNVPDIKPAT